MAARPILSPFTKRKATKMAAGTVIVKFQFEKETKGALRYQEVDDTGATIDQAWARVGLLYLRKSGLERGEPFPRDLVVRIETSGTVQPVLA
jgi:hypothetical protein